MQGLFWEGRLVIPSFGAQRGLRSQGMNVNRLPGVSKRGLPSFWLPQTPTPPCAFCGPRLLRALAKTEGTFFSWPQHPLPPPPSVPVHARHPSHWVGECVPNNPFWGFPTYNCLHPMTQIFTALPFRKPLSGGSGLSAFIWSSISFLPQGLLGWIHFAEFLGQPSWMGGNIPACHLPGDSVSPAASSQEPESHSLGAGRERIGSLVQLLLEMILGTGVRWTLGLKPDPPFSSLVTWNKWLPEPQLFFFFFFHLWSRDKTTYLAGLWGKINGTYVKSDI